MECSPTLKLGESGDCQRSGSAISSCDPRYLGDSSTSRSTKEESQPPVRAIAGAHVGAG